MTDTALAAAYRAIRARLAGSGLSWAGRVYGDVIPASVELPVVTYFWQGGGEANFRRNQDAELVIIVKAVSYTQAEAFSMAAEIAALLNDKGHTDDADDHLTASGGWTILTCTQELAVHLVDMWAGAQPVFHEGHQYRLVMEVTS